MPPPLKFLTAIIDILRVFAKSYLSDFVQMLSRGSIAMEKAIKFIPDDNGSKKIKLVFHPSPP